MKRLLILAVSALMAAGMAFGQERNITVTFTDSKNKPVKNLEVYSYIKGTEELALNNSSDQVVMEDIKSDDTLSLVVGETIYDIPLKGAQTVHIYMKNRNNFEGYSLDNGAKVTRADSRSVNSEEWVKGAVDHASSYTYSSILQYIDARVASLRPVRTRDGVGLAINGNGNRPALIVVDGFEMSFEMLNASYMPWQIKSIDVDRAGAIWGLRGQNGVVNFTTMPI